TSASYTRRFRSPLPTMYVRVQCSPSPANRAWALMSTTMYGRYTPMTFSGANSLRKRGWAKARRFLTNPRIRSTASSLRRRKGSTMSGTAPLGICWLTESLFRHQWHRAWVFSAVLTTTSAPQAVHLKVSTSSVEATMSCEPDPMTRPVRVRMSWLMNSSSSCLPHSCRQNRQRSSPLAVLRLISVAPQRGHLANPSCASASVRTTCGPSVPAGGGEVTTGGVVGGGGATGGAVGGGGAAATPGRGKPAAGCPEGAGGAAGGGVGAAGCARSGSCVVVSYSPRTLAFAAS